MKPNLTKATVTGATSVLLLYDDQLRAELDLAPMLQGRIFEPLKNPDFFGKFEIESETLRWPNGADIDPDVLRFWAESGRIVNQEETDAHFARLAGTAQNVA